MAPLLFRELKGSSLSCTSPASAAICTSIDRRSVVCPGAAGRAIDRNAPRLRDSFRSSSLRHPPTIPKPYNQKSRKSLDCQPGLSSPSVVSSRHRKSIEKQLDLISPANSSRYLLNDNTLFFDVIPDPNQPVPALPAPRLLPPERDESAVLRPSSSTIAQIEVVVLRVSLHCKGCEGKVRRHISKMEGVTSFNIDMATKKVTVVGNVTPLGVLNSVSKVKNAEFWSSPPRSSVYF